MYVYFIEAFGVQELKRIKIGRAQNPEARLSKLQTGSPVKLQMIGTIKCKSDYHAQCVERLAHNIFYKQRRRGEWFHLSRNHLKQIKSLISKTGLAEAEVCLKLADTRDRNVREERAIRHDRNIVDERVVSGDRNIRNKRVTVNDRSIKDERANTNDGSMHRERAKWHD